jgi:hypothetical protein
MRKFTVVLLLICGLIAFAFSFSGRMPARDAVAVAKLSSDQRNLIDLLTVPGGREILLFDFSTRGSYDSLEVWVETYRGGELINYPAGITLYSDQATRRKGQMAVVIDRSPDLRWTLIVVDNDAKAIHDGQAEAAPNPALARADSSLSGRVAIEDGKEIILYSSVFIAGEDISPAEAGGGDLSGATSYSVTNVYDTESLQERPDLLGDYPYAHLVKCRFSKASAPVQ